MQLRPTVRANRRQAFRAGADLALVAVIAFAAISAAPTSRVAGPPAAVVELFTSEGCSSCPPADALLGDLAAEARDRRLPVYCLAFHVDYWDRLGWKDPFSSAAYSDRQWAYARSTNSTDVYTPEMIVNGTERFVGSDRARAARAIEAALARPAEARVELRPLPEDGAAAQTTRGATSPVARFGFSVFGAPSTAVLRVAAVEGGLVSHVARGENSGRVLRHENVVRAFLTVPLKDRTEGTIAVPIPRAAAGQRTAVIAFVQTRSMAIVAATAIDYPGALIAPDR